MADIIAVRYAPSHGRFGRVAGALVLLATALACGDPCGDMAVSIVEPQNGDTLPAGDTVLVATPGWGDDDWSVDGQPVSCNPDDASGPPPSDSGETTCEVSLTPGDHEITYDMGYRGNEASTCDATATISVHVTE